ncbi:MAG: hypothetical protein HY897_15205 [Deltaproteobacteria bacterium]|nr:hypothetical protein [Deltaproteobacteria bacterium]
MSVSNVEHKLPEESFTESYYEEWYGDPRTSTWETDKGDPGEMVAKAHALQAFLDKWDSIMNDPNIPEADKVMFKALFVGKMNALEAGDGGLSKGEGFDDVLAAIESGDMNALNEILLDTVDMDQLFEAVGTAFKDAEDITGIEPETDQDRLIGMYFTSDWAGIERYKIEHKDDDKKNDKDKE